MTPPGENPNSLAAQASKLEAILESAVDSIITIDAAGIITTANPAAEHLFGYPAREFLDRNVSFLMPEPYRSQHDAYLANYLRTRQARIIGIGREVVGLRSDGTQFPMHLAVSEFTIAGESFFTGIIRDLSAQKDAEQALLQAQKMEAMGQLTGGIAHDFNNLLTVIIGNLEMLERKLTSRLHKELVRESLEAAEVGSRLTTRLLAFARRSYLEPAVVNLNSFALNLTDMLHRTLGETILLSTALSPDLWPTRTDASQVESVIVNLAVNARDAMTGGGRLVLETRNVKVDEEFASEEDGLQPGDYVRFSVSDTGSGMPPAVRNRAFEPFFTTKEKGRGTGLGLSMVYGFAKQSGGHATIYSEEGKGTTVNIYLPRYVSEEAVGEERFAEDVVGSGNGECILVVEDDDRVRRLTLARLSDLGYRTLEAANGAEALEVLGRHEDVDLIFTDLVMPGGMSGYDLAGTVRRSDPGMRILLTSGYAEELTQADRLAAEHLRVLRKPYRQAELSAAIFDALRR